MAATAEWNAGDWVTRDASGLSAIEMRTEAADGRAEIRDPDDEGYVLRVPIFRRVMTDRPKWQARPMDTYVTCRTCTLERRVSRSHDP